MEDEQIKKIKDAKEVLNGMEKIPLLEVLLYIDELVKNYEARHKV